MSVVTGIRQTARPRRIPLRRSTCRSSVRRPPGSAESSALRPRLPGRHRPGLRSATTLPAQATTLASRSTAARRRDLARRAGVRPVRVLRPADARGESVAHRGARGGTAGGARGRHPRGGAARKPMAARRAMRRGLDADPVRIGRLRGHGPRRLRVHGVAVGSVRDGAILNQNQASYDWDGTWFHAVSGTMRPGTSRCCCRGRWRRARPATATRASSASGSRFVKRKAHVRVSAISPSRPTFVADPHRHPRAAIRRIRSTCSVRLRART